MALTDDQGPEIEPELSIVPLKRSHTILGRLAHAVREQNWFAVALEVRIVVLGVVISFQVTSWGHERADRTREHAYLRQLADDLRESERPMDAWESGSRPYERATTQIYQAFYKLLPAERREPFPFDAERFLTSREAHSAVVASAVMRSNYDWSRKRMRARSKALREQVTAELNR